MVPGETELGGVGVKMTFDIKHHVEHNGTEKGILSSLLNPDILCFRELWRAFKKNTGSPEKFSSVLREAISTSEVHRIKGRYKPYHQRKLCWLVPTKLHEKLLDEFKTTDYGRYLDFTRFVKIKKRIKKMRKHLVEEFVAAAKRMGLGVEQHEIEFLTNGTLIREKYWALRVPGVGSFVLVFRQFNSRDVSLCDVWRELGVAKALYALRIVGRKTDFVRADKIEAEFRYPEVTPATKPVPLVVVAPEVNTEHLRKVGVQALYINGPRYVPGFADIRSNYHGQVKTRKGLRVGLEIALESFVFFLFKRRYPRAKDAYVIFRMKRCGIVFERDETSLADFLPEKLKQPIVVEGSHEFPERPP